MKAYKPEPVELIQYQLGQKLTKTEIKDIIKALKSEHTVTYPVSKRISTKEISLTIQITLQL